MAFEQKGLKIGLGEAGNKVRVIIFVGNTASYSYTHSNAQESHFSCRYSQEAWRFAGSNSNKRLALNGLIRNLLLIIYQLREYVSLDTSYLYSLFTFYLLFFYQYFVLFSFVVLQLLFI